MWARKGMLIGEWRVVCDEGWYAGEGRVGGISCGKRETELRR